MLNKATRSIPRGCHSGPHGEIVGPAPVVETRSGKVQGLNVDGINRYLGMRYAAPPVGNLRFKPPVDPEPWTGIMEAMGYGAPAIQGTMGASVQPNSDFALMQMTYFPIGSNIKIHNEDCMWINVWTPGADDMKRPVLVWFHGGGFAYGSGAEPIYEGSNLARRGDIVVVTLNHRLNIFGFMNLAGIDPEFANSTNLGMLDLVHALKWVRDHIAAFGGDPDNVTIAGESGGGGKVSHFLGMPAARGLFHRAIIQSGPGLAGKNAASIAQDSVAILKRAGMGDTFDRSWLERVSAEHLVRSALTNFRDPDKDLDVQFRPVTALDEDLAARLRTVVDGEILPRHPFEPDASPVCAEVPLLIGWMKDEWTLMMVEEEPDFIHTTEEELIAGAATMYEGRGLEVLDAVRRAFPDYTPGYLASALVGADISYRTTLLAGRKAEQAAPVYVYQLAWETPVGDGIYKTPHALDLPLMFDNVEQARAMLGEGPEPQRLADQMADAWIAFIREGDPNTGRIPYWPRYDTKRRATMIFDLESRVVDDPLGEVHARIGAAQPVAPAILEEQL